MVQLPETFPAAGIGRQEAEGWYWALSRPLGSVWCDGQDPEDRGETRLCALGRKGASPSEAAKGCRSILGAPPPAGGGLYYESCPSRELSRAEGWRPVSQCLSEWYQMVPISHLPAPSHFLSYPKSLEIGSCGQTSGLCLLLLAQRGC